MDLHQKNADLYERMLKTMALHFRVTIASGVAKADLASAVLCATETDDAISAALDITLSDTPDDGTGKLSVALKSSEVAAVSRVLEARTIAASAAFGTVAVSSELTANGDVVLSLDSDQDITGDDGTIDLELKLLLK